MSNAPPEHPDPRALPHLPHADPSARQSGVNRVHGDGSSIPTWLESAACRDLDTELFFPVSPEGPGRRQAEEAKAVCKPYPVHRRWQRNSRGRRDLTRFGTRPSGRRAGRAAPRIASAGVLSCFGSS
ncbi:WhiB family transcriptional regulator [Streptomyces sp. NPDC003996]